MLERLPNVWHLEDMETKSQWLTREAHNRTEDGLLADMRAGVCYRAGLYPSTLSSKELTSLVSLAKRKLCTYIRGTGYCIPDTAKVVH